MAEFLAFPTSKLGKDYDTALKEHKILLQLEDERVQEPPSEPPAAPCLHMPKLKLKDFQSKGVVDAESHFSSRKDHSLDDYLTELKLEKARLNTTKQTVAELKVRRQKAQEEKKHLKTYLEKSRKNDEKNREFYSYAVWKKDKIRSSVGLLQRDLIELEKIESGVHEGSAEIENHYHKGVRRYQEVANLQSEIRKKQGSNAALEYQLKAQEKRAKTVVSEAPNTQKELRRTQSDISKPSRTRGQLWPTLDSMQNLCNSILGKLKLLISDIEEVGVTCSTPDSNATAPGPDVLSIQDDDDVMILDVPHLSLEVNVGSSTEVFSSEALLSGDPPIFVSLD